MEEITSIIGAVTGIVSLLTILYLAVRWKSNVDKDRDYFRKCIEQYPPAEMWTMAKTLWDIYVVDALRTRPDLAEHHSAYKLKPEGEDLIPDDIKQELTQIPHNPNFNDEIASGYLVVKFLGLERVSKMAEQKSLSVQEAIAILSTYLDEKNRHS